MKLRKVYRFRMRPTAEQEQQLRFQSGARRFVWNWALGRKSAYYKKNGKGLLTSVLKAELPKMKEEPETAWLKGADSQALQETLRDLDRAFDNFFEKRAAYPRFKALKRSTRTFRVSQRVKVSGGAVNVPKIGSIRIRQSQPVDGETKSATIKQDASGNWDVSLVSEFTMPDTPLIPADPSAVVGVDLGLKDFAVLSNGKHIPAPKFFRRRERKLRRAQRALARRQMRSNRRAKAKKAVARIHAKTANQRSDFIHKLTTELVREHEGICIEDLSIKGLAKTKLAKSVLDAALGMFRGQLEYKTLWNRRHLAIIDRWFPSSKTCHVCGCVNEELTLADRAWVCCCGAIHDRDLNAALNLRSEGLKLIPVAHGYGETLNFRGLGVRLPHLEAVGVEPRIPRLLAVGSINHTGETLSKQQRLTLHSISLLPLLPQIAALLPVFRWLGFVVFHPMAQCLDHIALPPPSSAYNPFVLGPYTSETWLLAIGSIVAWLTFCVAVTVLCFRLTLFCVSFCLRAVARKQSSRNQ